ncbi:MAG: hypothetical protein ACKO6N_10935 [Myxococcota bacterium]
MSEQIKRRMHSAWVVWGVPGFLVGCSGVTPDESPEPSATSEVTASVEPDSPPPEEGSPTPSLGPETVTPGATPTLPPSSEVVLDELLLAADNGSNQFKILDPGNNRLLYSVDLGALNPSYCGGDEDCFIFGGHHNLLEGHDYLTMAYGLQTTRGLNTGFQGFIDRVKLTSPPTLRWRLHGLNFSGLPGGATAYCPAKPENPCEAEDGLPIEEQGLCWVGDAHDVEVLSDDALKQEAELVVADTDNLRLLRVKLKYGGGNTCGEVVSVLDGNRNADWPAGAEPNHLLRVPEEGRELYLLTQRALTHTEATDGDGVLQLWEYAAEGWRLHWTFPEQISGTERAFSLPHGGELLLNAHPEGHLFRFAHSASLAVDREYKVNDSSGGSASVLLLRNVFEVPDYLYDLYFTEGNPEQDILRFPRFVERQPDGTMLLTDSGCQADVRCDYLARVYWVRDDWDLNSPLGGYWTPDRDQLELISGEREILHSMQCGLISPFWVIRIPTEQLGEELQQMSEQSGTACRDLR